MDGGIEEKSDLEICLCMKKRARLKK